MSDASRREVERRARAGGAFADRVALLRERVRAGVLALDRLRLAAYLGDEAAVEALAGAPSVMASADEPEVMEVTDDAAFALVLEAERAVGVVHFPWSGYCQTSTSRLREVHAPCLFRLAPEAEILVFVLQLDDFPGVASGAGLPSRCFEWLVRAGLMPTGAGEILWLRRGGHLARCEYPARVEEPADFVRATVEALGLGLDDA